MWGAAIVVLCLSAYVLVNPHRSNFYIHFVWQAQAWLDGQTSIPTGVQGTDTSPGNDWYQDVEPILGASGQDTGRGIIPFPPLPALVLLPFVAIWHLATNEYLLSAIFAAMDVAVAYWMLGSLPIVPLTRRLVTIFLGLGTVLLYAAAIGSTWFWAHVVALTFLLGAVGLALSADREAATPRPAGRALREGMRPGWPGGLATLASLVAGGALVVLLFRLAESGASATTVAGVGLVAGIAAAALAVAAAGRASVLAPVVAVLAVVGGIPAACLVGPAYLGVASPLTQGVVVAGVGTAVVVTFLATWLRPAWIDRLVAAAWRALTLPESRQVAAGMLFGLACLARLTIVFGFPFLILVGGGKSWLRRGLLAGAGAAMPLLALLVYTFASTGNLFNPAYDYLYHRELGYWFLNYHADWSIEDLRYVPQNLEIMFLRMPLIAPAADIAGNAYCTAGQARGVFNTTCPLVIPDQVGTSLILSSPAYLLAPLAFVTARARQLDRATVGAAIAVVAIAFVNLMHFSQGWVQFGYRFSNDFAPFALILVALGAARIRAVWPLGLLVGMSIAMNLWGAIWGVTLGW
jgi:hypothetical protein